MPVDPTRDSDVEPEVNQPGLTRLREAVANYAEARLPSGGTLRRDATAGLNSALASVPDGMASGLLAGVNPIYGLYACMMGPVAGGIFSSTRLMVVATTSAASLGAGQALVGLLGEARASALFAMVILIGAFQILFGVLGLGRVTRFVSYSVMTGFISGIAVLTVLTQLPTITGYQPPEGQTLVQVLNLLANLHRINFQCLILALVAMALAIALRRTPIGGLANLLAIAVPSAIVAFFGWQSVQIVRDVGTIPEGVPVPALPSISAVTPDVITGALAVAIIILVQGAGVSQSVPNPDGTRRSMSGDFIGQGAANVASGFFQGLPVGASLSSTALSVLSGARTRWAAIFAGLWMAVIVVAFPGVVSRIAMPALGALLVVASASTIKPSEILSIWNTGWASRLPVVTTFLATLLLPIQAAVIIGMVLTALLYVYRSSADVSVVEMAERPDGRIEERQPARKLASNRVTMLDVYGHIFFAGARSLERMLPEPRGAEHPVVIMRLRGRTVVGATLVDVLSSYASKLEDAGGRLYLSGIHERVKRQMAETGKLRLIGPERVYEATPIVGQSTRRALADAQAWLVSLGTSAMSHDAAEDGSSSETVEKDDEA